MKLTCTDMDGTKFVVDIDQGRLAEAELALEKARVAIAALHKTTDMGAYAERKSFCFGLLAGAVAYLWMLRTGKPE